MLAFDHLQLVKLFLEEPFLRVLRQRNALETGVCDDDGVPIPRRDAAEQLLAIRRLEVLLAGDEDVRAWIERQQLSRELAKHVVWHGEQWLSRKAEALQLHRRCDHRERLARADNVREQRVGRLQCAPDAGLLVRLQRDGLARTGQRQMLAVEGAKPRVIEGVIVKSAEPFAPRIIRPYPFLEPLLGALLLFASRFRRLRVDDRILLFVEVIDCRRLEIQRVFDEVEGGAPVSTPISVLAVAPFTSQSPFTYQVPSAWTWPTSTPVETLSSS